MIQHLGQQGDGFDVPVDADLVRFGQRIVNGIDDHGHHLAAGVGNRGRPLSAQLVALLHAGLMEQPRRMARAACPPETFVRGERLGLLTSDAARKPSRQQAGAAALGH